MAVEILTIQEFNFFLSPLEQIVVIADIRDGPKVMIICYIQLTYKNKKSVFFLLAYIPSRSA